MISCHRLCQRIHALKQALTTGHGKAPSNVDSIRLAMVMRKGDMVGDSVIPRP